MTRRTSVSPKLRRIVTERAASLCEYCHLIQDLCPEPFEVDHIVPRAAGGATTPDNLCFACPVCNNAKRSRMSCQDPESGARTRLFHPRLHLWDDHFDWTDGFGVVVGKTEIGRATVEALGMNHSRVVKIRRIWALLGLHPP
jgi:hypothetical protein